MEKQPSFIIYDASAGSGKTFTLVRNYISTLLLSPNITAYKHILALTFTNKAVAEMKNRILESLKAFSANPIPENHLDLFSAVQDKTKLTKVEIQEKSAIILKSILHNYAAFEVSTIDSFTHRILRTFAKDLNIPINFEVQLDTEEILNEAVDRVIAKAGKKEEKELTKAMIDFALSKADDDRSWDIAYDLNEIAKLLVNDNHLEFTTQLENISTKDFADFTKELYKKIESKINFCVEKAEDFFALIQANGVNPKNFMRGSIPNYFKKLQQKNLKNIPPLKTPAWAENIDNPEYGKHYKKAESPEIKQTIDQILPQIAQLYFQTLKAILEIKLYKRIVKVNPSLSLLTAIQKEVNAIKEERNLLLISDFNKRIYESIKNEPAPFIYERLGERYHIYYIDEFQDTSVLQWKNLMPLIENSLAAEKGQLTLVGDAKQSIYRWRGGKAEQFMDLNAEENPFNREKFREKLPFNYRSLKEVVEFNNEFFKTSAEFIKYQPYKELFKNAEQKIAKNEGGYVEINFIEAKNKTEENEIYPEKILEIINNLKSKNHEYEEICILVRKKDEGVVIADFLSENNIPITSSETLLLEKSDEIQFLIALMNFSLNPTDKTLKFELLNFLYKHFKVEEDIFSFLYSKLNLTEKDFFKSLKSLDIHFELNKFQALPFYDAIEYSLRSFKLEKTADAYLQFFLDFVFDYTEKHSGGLTGFLTLWEIKKDKLSITLPEGNNAVQIMTIHKAKGLEFPIVIYPFANEKIDDTSKDKVWVNLEESKIPITYLKASQELEKLSENTAAVYQDLLIQKELDVFNVFYVAMTRAEKQLYILSKYEVDKNGNEKSNLFSGLLIHYLKSKNLWQKDQLQYHFGKLPLLKKSKEKQTDQLKLENFISSAPEKHGIAVITTPGMIWGSIQEKAIEKGKLIHNLLQKIFTAEDINKVLEEAVLAGEILSEEYEDYVEKIKNIVFHPELKPYFSKEYEIFTEKEILIQREYKRLDRLCIKDKNAVIIDYKTGNYNPTHEKQINTYANALEKMNYQIQEKLLVYIEEEIRLYRVS